MAVDDWWRNETERCPQGRWRRIELYAQDSTSPTEPMRSGVGAKADVMGWGCSFEERGREHYIVSRYGRGRALRGRPQCLPAAAAQREWRWRHPRWVIAARGRHLLRERGCTTQTTLQAIYAAHQARNFAWVGFGKAYNGVCVAEPGKKIRTSHIPKFKTAMIISSTVFVDYRRQNKTSEQREATITYMLMWTCPLHERLQLNILLPLDDVMYCW